MTANPQTCPKCGSPVQPGMKFCETCGAKIEALPVCPKCGAAIAPGVKFCETCGAPVGPAVTAPATPMAELPVKVEEKAVPVPVETPVPPAVTVKNEPKPVPVPADIPAQPVPPVTAEEKAVPAPAPVKEIPKTDKVREVPKESGVKKPLSTTTMILAGVIVLALLGAAVYFVVLPMLSGTGSAPAQGSSSTIPSLPFQTQSPAAQSSAAESATAPVSFVTEATQNPPANLLVTFQAERDPITGLVTITFTGGAGRYGVQNVDIRLTRSDGQVISRTVTIPQIGDGLTLEGTKTGDDRIELTVNYNNGEHYRVIDRILEYKKRNW